MPQNPAKLVVVGHGAAGLAAALSAAEAAQSRGLAVDITVLEKAREDEAGGNTRWSPSNMRLDAPDRIDPGFADDMLRVCGERGDAGYFRALADNATATVGWLQRHGVEFVTPLIISAPALRGSSRSAAAAPSLKDLSRPPGAQG